MNETALDENEAAILGIMPATPTHQTELRKYVEIDDHALWGALLGLELEGLIRQFPGKRFALQGGGT